jgi:hypothetical protein
VEARTNRCQQHGCVGINSRSPSVRSLDISGFGYSLSL